MSLNPLSPPLLAAALLVTCLAHPSAAQVPTEMPKWDASRFVDNNHSFDPLLFPSRVTYCFDSKLKHAAVLTPSDFRNDDERWLLIYELATGQVVRRYQMADFDGFVVALASDLKSFVVRNRDREDNLVIWKCSPEKAERVKTISIERSISRTEKFVYSNPQTLLHLEKEQSAVAYNIKDGSEKFTTRYSLDKNQTWQWTPDRCFLYSLGEDSKRVGGEMQYRFFAEFSDLKDGSKAARVELQSPGTKEIRDLRLSPDGTTFFGVRYRKTGRLRESYAFWNAKNGALLKECDRPQGVFGPKIWLTDDLIKIGMHVLSVREGRVLARIGDIRPIHIESGPGLFVFSAPLGQHYRVVNPSPLRGYNVVYSQRLDEQALRTATTAEAYRDVMLKRGDAVSLSIRFSKSPSRQFQTDFEEAITEALESAGYVVAANAPVEASIVVSERDLGRTVEFSQIVGPRDMVGGKTTKIREVQSRFDIEFIDRGGNKFGKGGNGSSIPFTLIQMERGETVQQTVRKWRWENVLVQARGYRFQEHYTVYNIPTVPMAHRPNQNIVKVRAEEIEVAAALASGGSGRGMGRRKRGTANIPAMNPVVGGKLRTRPVPLVRESAVWNVAPYKLVPLPQGTLVNPMSITGGEETPHGIKLAYVKTKQAAVLLEDDSNDYNVYRYDLVSRRMLTETPVRRGSRLLDLRLDGKYFVVTHGSRNGYLQIFKTNTDPKERVRDEALKTLRVRGGSGEIVKAWFAGADNLVVCWADRIAGYSIRSEELLFSLDVEFDLEEQPLVWEAADRTCFVQFLEGRIRVCNCADGSVMGELPVRFEESDVIRSIAFSPDGQRFAILTDHCLEIRNLKNGQLDEVIVNDEFKGPLQWCDDNFMLSMNMLISLDLGAAVWQYGDRWSTSPFLQDDHAAGWYQAANNVNQHFLIQCNTPNKRLYKQIGNYLNRVPKIMSKGDTVALRVELQDELTGDKGTSRKVSAAMTEQLKRAGYQVGDIGIQRVIIRASLKETDDIRQDLQFDGSGNSFTVPDYLITGQVFARSAAGEEREIDRAQFHLSAIDYSIDMRVADPKKQLLDQFKQALIDRLSQPRFPGKVYQADDHRLGQSKLRDGIEYPILSKKGKALLEGEADR